MTNDTTTLNGALTELGETLADNLVSMGVLDAEAGDGLTTLAGKILDIEPSIGGLDLDTAITLSSSSASISYGQSVVLTSKLTASYDDETLVNVDLSGVLTGATVLFKEGNTTVATGITDVNGVATATVSSLSAGTHTLKAVFEGTDNFNECESSTVSVVVGKSTPALSITGPSSVVITGDDYTISGVLSLNGSGVAGATVVLENKTTSQTWNLTSDSNGAVSKTFTGDVAGTLSFDLSFAGDSNLNSVSSSTVQVVISDGQVPASVSLTGDKSILSYADSESATLSATVLDSGSVACEGVTVEFFKGSTSLGTATTNSSGVATKTYASTGAGDVSFTAEVGSLVSETYVIEDTQYYDSFGTSSTKTTFTSVTTDSSFTLANTPKSVTAECTTYECSGGGKMIGVVSKALTDVSNFEISFDFKTTINSRVGVGYGVRLTNFVNFRNDGTTLNYSPDTVNPYTQNSWMPVTLRVENGTVTATINNISSVTVTLPSGIEKKFCIFKWATPGAHGGYISIKNLKVKPL